MTTRRYWAENLQEFAFNLLCRKGLQEEMAQTVADVLLEGDLLGHTTHGLMMVNPAAFGGREKFMQESSWIAKACLDAEPLDDKNSVRLPGQAALRKKRHYLKTGVELDPGILPSLENWSSKLGIPMPGQIPTK